MRTGLQLAVKLKNLELVSMFLAQDGIKVDKKSVFSETALSIALSSKTNHDIKNILMQHSNATRYYEARREAIRYNLGEITKIFHINPDNLNVYRKILENNNTEITFPRTIHPTALILAAYIKNTKAVKTILKTTNVSINSQDEQGNTALIVAARHDKSDTVKLLLEQPDLTIKNNQNETALMLAARFANIDTIVPILNRSSLTRDDSDTLIKIIDKENNIAGFNDEEEKRFNTALGMAQFTETNQLPKEINNIIASYL